MHITTCPVENSRFSVPCYIRAEITQNMPMVAMGPMQFWAGPLLGNKHWNPHKHWNPLALTARALQYYARHIPKESQSCLTHWVYVLEYCKLLDMAFKKGDRIMMDYHKPASPPTSPWLLHHRDILKTKPTQTQHNSQRAIHNSLPKGSQLHKQPKHTAPYVI